MALIHDESRTTVPGTPARPGEQRSWFRRPAVAVPLAAFALAGVVAGGVALTGQGGDSSGVATGPLLTTDIGTASVAGTGDLLDRISLAAAAQPVQQPQAGQFTYVDAVTADTFVRTKDDKSSVVSEKPHRRQVWLSPDGRKGWLTEPGDTPADGMTLDSTEQMSAAWDGLAKLPKDPDALLKKLYADSEGQGNSPDQAAFSRIGELLGDSVPPAGLEAALYKAAAKIPGVVRVDNATDAKGRQGIAVARMDKVSGQREEWIFEKNSLDFLGTRTVQVTEGQNPNAEDRLIKTGTVLYISAVTSRAVVDGIKQTPERAS